MTTWDFRRWRNLLVWHVMAHDGLTVCRMNVPEGRCESSSGAAPSGILCKRCKSMRRAQTVLPLERERPRVTPIGNMNDLLAGCG